MNCFFSVFFFVHDKFIANIYFIEFFIDNFSFKIFENLFQIVFVAVFVAANAQYIRDFGAIVHGGKTTIAGPSGKNHFTNHNNLLDSSLDTFTISFSDLSGTIHADTGAIVKTPETRAFLPAPVIAHHAPLVHAPLISAPLLPRTVVHHSPLLTSRTIVHGSPLLHDHLGFHDYGYGFNNLLY